LDSTRCNGNIGRCNGRKTSCSKRDYSDVSFNGSSSVIWKITREYLNCDDSHKYCVLGVMSDGKWIRGVSLPSRVVMCVTWQLDTWRVVAITCCDVCDMAIGYVACGAITYCDVCDMAIGYVACGAITYCDVGEMAIVYVACGGITHCDVGEMAMEYVETKVEPKRGISIRGISIYGSRYAEPINHEATPICHVCCLFMVAPIRCEQQAS
jgi:hypothetical protein